MDGIDWKYSLLSKGAAAFSSTFHSFFLQEGDSDTSLIKTVLKIASALIEVAKNWPDGTPVNGVSIVLEVLQVAEIADVGDKFENLILTVTQRPQIEGTVFEYFYVPAIILGTILFLVFFGQYAWSYAEEMRTEYGEQRLWNNQGPVVNLLTYAIKRFVPMILILGAFVFLIQGTINIFWWGIESVALAFYAGSDITIGGAYVLLLARMAEGLSAVWFLISFGILVFGGSIILIVYLVRFVRFLWSGVVVLWQGTKSLSGKRNVTLGPPVKTYVETLSVLAITAFLILILPWFAYMLSELFTGIWIVAFIIVTFYFVWWAPKEVFARNREILEPIEGWLDTEIEPEFLITRGNTNEDRGIDSTSTNDFHSQQYVDIPVTDAGEGYTRPSRLETIASLARDAERHKAAAEDLRRTVESFRSTTDGDGEDIESSEEETESQPSETSPKFEGYSEVLYQNRDSLSEDPHLNDALYAWLSGMWEIQPPLQPFNQAVKDAEEDLSEIRSFRPEEFEALVDSGRKRRASDEVEHGNLGDI
jgi:hypothetical protein